MSELAGLQITKWILSDNAINVAKSFRFLVKEIRHGVEIAASFLALFSGELKQIDFDELLALAGPCENCGGSLLICGEGNTLVCDRCRLFGGFLKQDGSLPRTFGETLPLQIPRTT